MDSEILNLTSSTSIIIFIVFYIIKNFHKCKSKCCDKEIEFTLSENMLSNKNNSNKTIDDKNKDMI